MRYIGVRKPAAGFVRVRAEPNTPHGGATTTTTTTTAAAATTTTTTPSTDSPLSSGRPRTGRGGVRVELRRRSRSRSRSGSGDGYQNCVVSTYRSRGHLKQRSSRGDGGAVRRVSPSAVSSRVGGKSTEAMVCQWMGRCDDGMEVVVVPAPS